MSISNIIRAVITSKPVGSLTHLLESRPVSGRAAIGAITGATISLAAVVYIDAFHPEHSAEIRKLIDYQAPQGWGGARDYTFDICFCSSRLRFFGWFSSTQLRQIF